METEPVIIEPPIETPIPLPTPTEFPFPLPPPTEFPFPLPPSTEFPFPLPNPTEFPFPLPTPIETPFPLPTPIESQIPLPTSIETPLVYNDTIDTTNMTNILLIDSTIYNKQIFYDSANTNTFPIIYSSNFTTDDFLALLRQKFPASSIQRISLVFHDRGPNVQAPFMNNKIFFEESDLEENATSFSENVSFLISCIKEFHVSHIDFLACNTLQYSNWKSYYALLASQTSVVVGASNDATGNIQYGGDWTMESTGEDVMQIYFNANISNFVSLLASTISASGTLYFRMDPSGQFVQYVIPNISSNYVTIPAASWPITIVNTTTTGAALTVYIASNISLSTTYTGGVNSYLIAGSINIIFNGQYYRVYVNGITGYPGFIQNGTSGTSGRSLVNVQNFYTDASSSILSATGGWLCQSYFGNGAGVSISNCYNYALVSGTDASNNNYSGGIAGRYVGSSGGNVTFNNCINFATATITAAYGGGIAGGSTGYRVTFNNCYNYATITGEYAGGIAGERAGNLIQRVTFSGCYNFAAATIAGRYAGGIAGRYVGSSNGYAYFNNCYNYATITGEYAGGIAGESAGISSLDPTFYSVTFYICGNYGNITGGYAGGIAGGRAGISGGNVTFSICANNGKIFGSTNGSYIGAGGIAGAWLDTDISGNVTFSTCTNNGEILCSDGGGIAGSYCGVNGGLATFTSCVNNGALNGDSVGAVRSGGIVGSRTAYNNGICTITTSVNNGSIKTNSGGGIVGAEAGRGTGNTTGGKVTCIKCYNIGAINTAYAGGIVGGSFGINSNKTFDISGCYNIAAITGTGCGGITGADLGRHDVDASGTSTTINITTCYNVGQINSTCGGIIGGWTNLTYITNPIITMFNCYSSGLLSGSGASLDAAAFYPSPTITNCYSTNGNWTDASANASLTSGTTPTNFTTNNPASIWTSVGTNTPYVLSSYNVPVYYPSSVTSNYSYRTNQGLFQPGFTYVKLNQSQLSNVLTIFVITYKGTSPNYYAYNTNTFVLTNGNGSATPMTSSINSLNGILDIVVPGPAGRLTITANGSSQSVYLRMNGTLIEFGFTTTGPWNTITFNNWYVTIANTSTTPLNVIFLENLTISNTYGAANAYFVIGSEYITIDGKNYNININNIISYGGFIENGFSQYSFFTPIRRPSYSNTTLQNIRINVNSVSTLTSGAGWLCRTRYGGSGISVGQAPAISNSILNCTNTNGIISASSAGGIAGSLAGYNGILTFTGCTNYGAITGQNAGGIAGQSAGIVDVGYSIVPTNSITLSFTNCTNYGNITGSSAGGIAGANLGNGFVTTYRAVSEFTNCINNGNITADYGGGIVGQYAGISTGANGGIVGKLYGLYFTGCTNSGSINGLECGGIAGQYAGSNGSVVFVSCTNTGDILVNTTGGGGIAGGYVGAKVNNAYSTECNTRFSNCTNSGNITGDNSGGIVGISASTGSSTYGITLTSCSNSGNIIGFNAGGIVGREGASWSGKAILNNCFSTGTISGSFSGGIVGSLFGYNQSTSASVLSNCYSIGNITGEETAGIVGADVGYVFGATTSPIVNISNCYSLGMISGIKAGGIVGGSAGRTWSDTYFQTINIKNCYSYGTISDISGGILSTGYDKPLRVDISYCYIGNGNWTDASANARLLPGTTPTSITINNPGSVWTMLSTTFIPNVPYVLSSFNGALYNPTSVSTASNYYSTAPGLFQPNFNYSILYPDQSGNVITPRVFASKGTSPYYYAYNSNTFRLTNTNGISGTINVAVAPSTGVLNFTLPIVNQPSVIQIPTMFTPYAENPNNIGQVIYTDASYVVVPDISNNPTYILSTNISDNTFDVFQNSTTTPEAFIPNSLFISNNLIAPGSIVKDSFGNFYVGNTTYNVISVYNNNGVYIRNISIYSSINIPLSKISYIAIDSSNNLYVTSDINSGVYVVPAGSNENNITKTILKYSYGNDCYGLACNQNYLYVVIKRLPPAYIIKYDVTNNTYLTLDLSANITSGQPLAIMYNNITTSSTPLYITTIGSTNNSVYRISNITGIPTLIGGRGIATITKITSFSSNLYPYSITMDNSSNLYVGLDEGLKTPVNVNSVGQIARLTSSGTISNTSYFSYNGLGIGRPEGLLFDGSLNLYVTDILHNRVIKSNPKTFVFGPGVLNADAFYVKDPSNNTQYKTYLYNITNSIIATTFNLAADCFQKGTRILCENDIYVPIENIKVGDLVKTYKYGYQKVIMCVTRRSCDYVSNSRNQIYTYTQKSNPELIEDLYLTGGHSLLVDELSEIESNDMKQTDLLDSDLMVEDKYKLMCCFNKKLDVSENQNVELYRFALEPPEDATPTHVYGIWANGILSESCSKASMDK